MVLKDGNVIDHGDYNTLMQNSAEFSRLIREHVDVPEQEAVTPKSKKKNANGKGPDGASEGRGMKRRRGEGGRRENGDTKFFCR